MARVIILGAGLTGLSAAYHLEKSNFYDFAIFEKQERAGGLLRSFSQDGFTFDFTGHLLHINDDYFKNFLNTICNLNNFLQVHRKAAIYTQNTTLEYPFQMNLHGLSEDIIYECIDGFIKRKTSLRKAKNFYDWVLKHFGYGMGKHFFFPYNSKILSYDIKKVHPSWTGRFVPQTSLKEVIRGAITPIENRSVGYNSFFYYPRQGGIEYLIKQLIQQIKTPIQTNHTVTSIDPQKKIIYFSNGKQEPYEQLITTMPLDKLLINTQWGTQTTLRQTADKLLCNTVVNFNLGFNVKDISAKHWLYFPEKKFLFYRLGFWNNICPSATPPETSAIYGELSFLPSKETSRQTNSLQAKAINQALSFLKLSPSNILTQKTLKLEHAYVIYDAWREKNLKKLLKSLEDINIFSIGRFGEWKYSSMQEAVLDGKKAAESITNIQHKKANLVIPATNLPLNKGTKDQLIAQE